MSSTTRAYRIDDHILAHLDYASDKSQLNKTTILKNALVEHLERNYPLPDAALTAAAKAPSPIY
jgi:hypothetical protein